MSVETLAPVRSGTRTQSPPARWSHAGWLPWSLLLLLCVGVLVASGEPTGDVLAYSVFWLGAIVVPGTLLTRLALGSRTLLEDVGVGITVGLAAQLASWAALSAVGLTHLLWAWPLAVAAVFAGTPRLRQHWRLRGSTTLPGRHSWLVAAVLAAVVVVLFTGWLRNQSLPPNLSLDADLWWHLALAEELTRGVTPEVPQAAGESLQYHWFANAHLAIGSLMTGIGLPAVLVQLWLVPMFVSVGLATAALAIRVSRSVTVGAASVALVAFVPLIDVTVWTGGMTVPLLMIPSPSTVFAGVLMTGLAAVLVDVVRGARLRPGVVCTMVVLAAACAGAKPTALPLLLSGVGVVVVRGIVRDRRVDGRLVGLLTAGSMMLAVSVVAVMGGGAGSRLVLFGFVRFIRTYATVTGDASAPVTGGPLLPSLTTFDARSWVFVLGAVAALLLSQLPRAVGLLGLALPQVRRDPAGWFLGGAYAASVVVALIVDHEALSQMYFLAAGIPFGAVLTAWAFSVALRTAPSVRASLTVVACLGLSASLASAVLWREATDGATDRGLVALVAPVLVFAVTSAVVVAWARRRGLVVLLGIGLVLAWSVPGLMAHTLHVADEADSPTAGEQRAAAWLADHTDPDEVVATNAQCLVTADDSCSPLSFWVSALSGRRVLLEGWAFTVQTDREPRAAGVRFDEQPTPWPDRLKISRDAIERPTPQILAELRDDYGVSWILADRRAGDVSPDLARLADLRFATKDAEVYQLRP
ncbi:MAG: hypothetical protein ACRDO1_12545 [Nocardioidaceae bacterium]